MGSLSSASNESQATDMLLWASHWASKLVLPKPAGAEISVSACSLPESLDELGPRDQVCSRVWHMQLGSQQGRE